MKMNRIGYTVVALGMLLAGAAWAGSACCQVAAGGAKAGGCPMVAKAQAACAGLATVKGLTDEQKTKIEALQAECKKAGSTAAACQKCMTDAEKILTVDQLKEWKAACCAKGAKACGKNAAAKTEAKP